MIRRVACLLVLAISLCLPALALAEDLGNVPMITFGGGYSRISRNEIGRSVPPAQISRLLEETDYDHQFQVYAPALPVSETRKRFNVTRFDAIRWCVYQQMASGIVYQSDDREWSARVYLLMTGKMRAENTVPGIPFAHAVQWANEWRQFVASIGPEETRRFCNVLYQDTLLRMSSGKVEGPLSFLYKECGS